MAVYRKIEIKTWNDSKFRSLSKPKPNAQTLWLHLLTGPHTKQIPGLSCVGPIQLTEQLGWPTTNGLRGFYRAFDELKKNKMAQSDWASRVIFISEAAKIDRPHNPNIVKSWLGAVQEIPECDLKYEGLHFIYQMLVEQDKSSKTPCNAFVRAFEEILAKAYPEGYPHGLAERLTKSFRDGLLNHSPNDSTNDSSNDLANRIRSRKQDHDPDQDPDQEQECKHPQIFDPPFFSVSPLPSFSSLPLSVEHLRDLDVLIQNEWNWLPIPPKWIARANALLPINQDEMRFAKAKVDQVTQGQGSNNTGLFIKIIQGMRLDKNIPKSLSRGAQQIEAMVQGAFQQEGGAA